MATWPAALGKPLVSNASTSRRPRVIETEMETGLPRRALVSKTTVTTGTGSFIWNATQKQLFETYWEGAYLYGTVTITNFPVDVVDGMTDHLSLISDVKTEYLIHNDTWQVSMSFITDEANAA